VCFPSYERIAEKAECARSTVAEALRVLEWAGVLTWQQRITRAIVRQRDLCGPLVIPLDRHPDQQRLRAPRPADAARRRSGS
jgi:DNA-binding FadR family transcriptional regulator